jgi:hypothetical protein
LQLKFQKLEKVTNDFSEVINYLKSKKFSKADLYMDNHLFLTPLITYFDYKKMIFPIHRVIAHFFEPDNDGFPPEYLNEALKFFKNTIIEWEIKEKVIKIMEDLSKCKKDFPEKCIKYYTGENLCYIINKMLRNFDNYYVELMHFIGPLYYGIFQYALKHENKQLKVQSTLYREVTMDRLDLYSYQFCEQDIICFPSFTSTTLDNNLKFQPSDNSKKINNDQIEEKSQVKMIIQYNPYGYCEPQGLDISKESEYPTEKEILLFPFTFLRINKVEIHTGKKEDPHLIFLTIINKGDILEYGLKKNYAFKLIEYETKIVIDKEHRSSYIDNESEYIMKLDYIEEKYL